jgi:hypothetical protein
MKNRDKIKVIATIKDFYKCIKGDCYYSGIDSCPTHGYMFMKKLKPEELSKNYE